MRASLLVGPFAAVSLCLGTSARAAEDPPRGPTASAKTWTVVAGPQYGASFTHRVFLGSGYRQLWTTPIEVEVLDLAAFSGGLTPEKKGGGKQTKGLRLTGADGREWRFRSIDKDPSAAVTKALQTGIGERIVQDQTSASHPGNALIVDALAEAAGLLHLEHRVVVLPDDERLGEFRKEFAGMLGTLEQTVSVKAPVTPGLEGFSELLETEELSERMDSDPSERLDTRAFLKARLFDVWIGDYDRHRDQWKWVKQSATGSWLPFPLDRDMAFVKFDGLVLDYVRQSQPRLVDFEDEFPSVVGITWQARFQDRRFLSELEWPAWQEVASELQGRLTDAVIDDAVRRQPAAYYELEGTALASRLKIRRQQLARFAREFYELLAREAEVYGSDVADTAQLLRQGDGSVEVVLAGPKGRYFRRQFLPGETREVRVFLQDGDDRAISEGNGSMEIKVRVVGGDGDDLLDDSAGAHTRFYDSSGENRLVDGPGTKLDKRPYAPPLDGTGHPKRDWGASTTIVPLIRAGGSLGVLLGAELKRTGFGFRKHPYGGEHSLSTVYSTAVGGARLRYEYESLRNDNRSRYQVFVQASNIEQIRFYGFGNETTSTQPDEFFEVEQRQLQLAPAYRLDTTLVDIRVGPVGKFAQTQSRDNLITLEQPYGTGDFGQVGARVGLILDGRDYKRAPSRGALLAFEGNYYPKAWSVEEAFGEVHGTASVYATAPMLLRPTLALRAGGKKVWGRYPFHEAAYIGGSHSIRGLRRQRYAGDAAAFGNAELRLTLLQAGGSLGPRFGIFGLADVGRVYLKGETSDRWHRAFGGGLWLGLSNPENTVSLAVAESEGRTSVYLEGGFMF
jgi:hypothetical protein